MNCDIRESGAAILRTQLEILATRIGVCAGVYLSNPHSFLLQHVLWLDTETYYTVAHDLLKVGVKILPQEKARRLKGERVYKIVAAIRNHLVRHAHDKPNGDPWPGFGITEEAGVLLKSGTPYSILEDPGFVVNSRLIKDLLEKYGFPESAFLTASRLGVLTKTTIDFANSLAAGDPSDAYEPSEDEWREWDSLRAEI